jgi:hypothetical protein
MLLVCSKIRVVEYSCACHGDVVFVGMYTTLIFVREATLACGGALMSAAVPRITGELSVFICGIDLARQRICAHHDVDVLQVQRRGSRSVFVIASGRSFSQGSSGRSANVGVARDQNRTAPH